MRYITNKENSPPPPLPDTDLSKSNLELLPRCLGFLKLVDVSFISSLRDTKPFHLNVQKTLNLSVNKRNAIRNLK